MPELKYTWSLALIHVCAFGRRSPPRSDILRRTASYKSAEIKQLLLLIDSGQCISERKWTVVTFFVFSSLVVRQKYKPFKGIKYVTKAGKFQVRS